MKEIRSPIHFQNDETGEILCQANPEPGKQFSATNIPKAITCTECLRLYEEQHSKTHKSQK